MKRWLGVLLILACCALTRVSTIRTLDVDNDEADYTTGVGFQYAEYLRAGDLLSILKCRENYEHPPLVKLVYGTTIAVSGKDKTPEEIIRVCRIVAALFACASVLLLFSVSRAGALVLCLHSWYLYYSSKGWLDAVLVFFLTAAFVLFVKAGRKWNRFLVLSAVALGAGMASKYVTGLFAGVIFFLLLLTFRRQPRIIAAYVAVSVVSFFALDPAIWLHPVANLSQSVFFHHVQTGTALYQRFLERYGGDKGPFAQFIALWGNKAMYQPEELMFGLDRLILVLGLLGLPFLYHRSLPLFLWFAAAALFLVLYPIKYPHYSMIFLPALALSAGEALRSGIPFLLARVKRLRPPRLLNEAGLTAAVTVAVIAYASVFVHQHRKVQGNAIKAYNSFAYTLTKLGRNEEAKAVFARSAEGGGELTTAAHLNMANMFLEQKKLAQAKAEIEQVFRADPDSPAGHGLLGNLYLAEGMDDEALAEYLKVDAGRVPEPVMLSSIWLNAGSIYVKQQRYDRSTELLGKALEANPSNAEAHYLLAVSHFHANRIGLAEKELQLALQNGMENGKLFHDLGVVYATQKRYPEARKAWERSLELDPKNEETRAYLERARRMGP